MSSIAATFRNLPGSFILASCAQLDKAQRIIQCILRSNGLDTRYQNIPGLHDLICGLDPETLANLRRFVVNMGYIDHIRPIYYIEPLTERRVLFNDVDIENVLYELNVMGREHSIKDHCACGFYINATTGYLMAVAIVQSDENTIHVMIDEYPFPTIGHDVVGPFLKTMVALAPIYPTHVYVKSADDV